MAIELSDEDRKELLQDYIPQERFETATGKLKDQNQELSNDLIRLQEQVKHLQASSAPPQEITTYTRAQLREYVESEKLSQEQSDEIWDRQVELSTDKKITDAVSAVSDSTTEQLSTQKLADGIDEYVKILPDLKKDDSDNREKVRGEYDSLAKVMGLPKKGSDQDLKMQLSALERAFGTHDKLKSRLRSAEDDRGTMETLGGTGNDPAPEAPKTGSLKNLSVDKKAYYQRGIESGRYKDWDAVKAELEYTRKET